MPGAGVIGDGVGFGVGDGVGLGVGEGVGLGVGDGGKEEDIDDETYGLILRRLLIKDNWPYMVIK